MKRGIWLFCLLLWTGVAWGERKPPQWDPPKSPGESVAAYFMAATEGGGSELVRLTPGETFNVPHLRSTNWVFVYVPCDSSSVSSGVVAVRSTKDTCSELSYNVNEVGLYRNGRFYVKGWEDNKEFEKAIDYVTYQDYYSLQPVIAKKYRPRSVLDIFHRCYENDVRTCLSEPKLRQKLFQYPPLHDRQAKMTSMFRYECSGGTWVPFWIGGDPVNKMRSITFTAYVVSGNSCIGEVSATIAQTQSVYCP